MSIETVLRLIVLDTRHRDYYDVLILSISKVYGKEPLQQAFFTTANYSGTAEQIQNPAAIR